MPQNGAFYDDNYLNYRDRLVKFWFEKCEYEDGALTCSSF